VRGWSRGEHTIACCEQTVKADREVTTYDLPMLSVLRLWCCPSRRVK
jgi:hypothetical protein